MKLLEKCNQGCIHVLEMGDCAICWTTYQYLLVKRGNFGMILDGKTKGVHFSGGDTSSSSLVCIRCGLFIYVSCDGGSKNIEACAVVDGVQLKMEGLDGG